MTRKSTGNYPPDWHQIAAQVKAAANWHCVRCGHVHDRETGYVLTVHHLDMNLANNQWWNLAALCQRCHLQVQAKVVINRPWMFAHSHWFMPYVAGYYAHRLGLPEDRAFVERHKDALIQAGMGRIQLRLDDGQLLEVTHA